MPRVGARVDQACHRPAPAVALRDLLGELHRRLARADDEHALLRPADASQAQKGETPAGEQHEVEDPREEDRGARERSRARAPEKGDGGGEQRADRHRRHRAADDRPGRVGALGVVQAVRPGAAEVQQREQRRQDQVGLEVERRQPALEAQEEGDDEAGIDEHGVDHDRQGDEAVARHLRRSRVRRRRARRDRRRRARRAGRRLLVHVQRARDHARDRELAAAHAPGPDGRGAPAAHRRRAGAESAARQRRVVARRDDESGDTVEIRVGHTGRQVGGHDRGARRVRLDLHKAEGLAASHARKAEHVGGAIPGRELGRRPAAQGRSHVRRSPLTAASARQLILERAAADQHEVGVHIGHGAHKNVDALVVHEPAHEQHDAPPGVRGPQLRGATLDGGRRRETPRRQAERHHAALLGARRKKGRSPDHVGRRCDDEVDPVEKPLEKGPVGGQQAPLANDVTVVQDHAGDVGARLQKRELRPRGTAHAD